MRNNNYIIAGANSYLGQAIAKHLAQSDINRVLLVTRKPFDFSTLESEKIKHVKGIDFLNKNHLLSLSSEANIFFKEMFNVINCMGYYSGQEPFNETSFEEASRIIESNFISVYRSASALIPIMINKGGGHFIAFTCNSVRYNYPQMASFTAAKSALESLVRSIANEYYDKGIYANAFQLATLLTEHEKMVKPYGDHKNWLKTIEVAQYIDTFIKQSSHLTNGNTISLYHHSDSFFHDSYFNRIKK